MKKTMKVCGVLVAVMLTGSASMAQYRGGHGYGGGGGHGYEGGHYGYYRGGHGELVFGLLGLGILAAAVSAQPVYVQPPQVVYQAPPVNQPPVQVAPQAVQQPAEVKPAVPADRPAPVTITVNVENSNGSYFPVTLRQEGTLWVGPKGEYYRSGVPSVAQLRPLYGL